MSTVIEEALTMPFISEKKVIVVKNSFIFTEKKLTKILHQIMNKLLNS